ncbi:hypothetical protein EJ110_NYTH27851 [Nymphaea thermarum]|nr:hypothetical protein EJ110_NYTH27851 [Nymphaea thermarum]
MRFVEELSSRASMDRRFVEWTEQFVSQERGNRVVHYIVKDSDGDSFVAVVGTERSLRHMVYVVSDEFLQVSGLEKSMNSNFKWRSRREVVDWLTSLLAKQQPASPGQLSRSPLNERTHVSNVESLAAVFHEPGSSSYSRKGNFTRKANCNLEIVWLGVSRTCGRQLKHYDSFSRNGIIVEVHSFVFVMSKDDTHYLAYVEDMYEDKKGKKKVKVRWFHQHQEVTGKVPKPDPHPKEVFITPYFQVISAECVDGVAFVLSPEDYRKCLAANLINFSAHTHLCFRQFSGHGVTSFNISKLKGYSEQRILTCIDQHVTYELASKSLNMEETEEFDHFSVFKGTDKGKNGKRHQLFFKHQPGIGVPGSEAQMMACNLAYRRLNFGHVNRSFAVKCVGIDSWVPYKVNDKVELLCQDSGIRGCWFRCTVLQVARKQLKVCYDDLQDDGGCGNLEEWIPAFRIAAPDKLGMRFSGRLTVRPCPPTDSSSQPHIVIGAPVDAWWNDGWWEGVVTSIDNCGSGVQVYFPGEDDFSVFGKKNLRTSKDWAGNQWVDIKAKPDVLSVISAISPGTKLSACYEADEKKVDSGGFRLLGRDPTAQSPEPSSFAGAGKDAVAKMGSELACSAKPSERNCLQDGVKQEDISEHASPDHMMKFHNETCDAGHSDCGKGKDDTGCSSDDGSKGGEQEGDNDDANDVDKYDDNDNEDDDGDDEGKTLRLEEKNKLSDGEVGSNLLVAVNVSS